MNTAAKQLRRFLFFLALILCMAASAALAADAVTVELNDVTLNAANPYWKNGGGGSASDWNAFFDTGTSMPTLYLKDAAIDTMNGSDELLYADGDIHLVLLGTNTLSYAGASAIQPAGIVVDGDLVISDGTAGGTGSLSIDIQPSILTFSTDGILTEYGDVTIEGGTIDILLSAYGIAYGLYAEDDLYIHGGNITVHSTGLGVSAVSVYYLNMTGGSITSTAVGEFFDSHALLFYEMLVTGGTGSFINQGSGYGGLWDEPVAGEFRVTGGQMTFQSHDEALFFYTDETLTPTVTENIYASEDFDGLLKFLWDPSKGILAGNEVEDSAFEYVRIAGSGEQPDTGDSSKPWLWLGAGLAALLAAAGVYLVFRRNRLS